MQLLEMRVVLVRRDVQPLVRHHVTGVERILARRPQRHELVVALAIGEIEARHPAHRRQRDITRTLQRLDQRAQFPSRRRAIEAANAHIHRMDRAAAEQFQDLVADLLQLQALAHDIAMVLRHLDRALVAEEVRRMQHVDVQRVALDPLAAIQQPAQLPHRLAHRDAERVLHRVHRAHLVGDRADAADACGDVGRLGVGAAAQESLEEARRLEDAQFDVAHGAAIEGDAHAALALHAGEVVDIDRLTSHAARPPRGTAARRR